MTLPTLFISHGAPSFALEAGLLGPALRALGQRLPRPRAILALSPHWMQGTLAVASGLDRQTVHDFGGFARELYALQYPAPGSVDVADAVIALLARCDRQAQRLDAHGRDHGVWVPLMHLYPEADVPVVQLSQPLAPSPHALLELGRALAPLREQGVLIIGTGSLTHNLRDVFGGAADSAYARTFSDWIGSQIASGDLGALLDYRAQAPGALRAHPTDEHLLPLFFALGAAGCDWTDNDRLEGGITHDVLAMDSFLFGTAHPAHGEPA